MFTTIKKPITVLLFLVVGLITLVSMTRIVLADFPIHMIEPTAEIGGPQVDGVVDNGPMGGDLDSSARTFVEQYNFTDEALEALLVLINSIEATLDRLEGQVNQDPQTTLKRLIREAVLTTRGLTRVGEKIEEIRILELQASSLQNILERAQVQFEINFIINEVALQLQGAQAISNALSSVAGILDVSLTPEIQLQLEESLTLLIVLERILVESLGRATGDQTNGASQVESPPPVFFSGGLIAPINFASINCQADVDAARQASLGSLCTQEIATMLCPQESSFAFNATNGCLISELQNRAWTRGDITEPLSLLVTRMRSEALIQISPIEGFTPNAYMQVFPGLVAADFGGVEAAQGVYEFSNGELIFVFTAQARHSAATAISETGMRTLAQNISQRLGIPLNDRAAVDQIMTIVRGIAGKLSI